MFMIPVCLIFVSVGLFVYAKYYSHDNVHGVAVASSIYFTANYAVETDKEDDYFENIVTAGYLGNDYNFDFEVRNYENYMLFNDSSVVIPYSVYFWLGEETDTAVYSVTYEGEKKTIAAGEDNKVSFSVNSISGGRAIANKYNISIDVSGDVVHTAVPIYVEVRTEPGAMIDRVLRGKMILSNRVLAESYIESAEFIISKDVDTDEEKYVEIEKLSELTYEIRTVGDVLSDDEVTEQIKLSWDSTVFEIDQYDSAYLEWLETTGKDVPGVDSNGWYYITINVMPYSANTVYFFRGEKFDEQVSDMESLNSFILVEKYRNSEEGTD